MKIWNGYGSEHSMNLVMIGRFKRVEDAQRIRELISQISEQVGRESETLISEDPRNSRRFSEEMMQIFKSANVYSIGPAELEQFEYDVHVDVNKNEVVLTTDESEISAFLKLLIEKGARVEIYSAHEYPDNDDNNL